MQANHEIIVAVYASFNRRDIPAVLARMHPQVDWPNAMEDTRVHGHAEVQDYWIRQWAVVDPHVEPTHIEDDETGHTVVDVHQVVHDLSGNLLLDQDVQHVYLIRDSLIEHMEIRQASVFRAIPHR